MAKELLPTWVGRNLNQLSKEKAERIFCPLFVYSFLSCSELLTVLISLRQDTSLHIQLQGMQSDVLDSHK